jgi:lipid A 3-O-deacylase
MKKSVSLLLLLCIRFSVMGQEHSGPDHFVRLYEENDGINAWGKGTDWGYTNVTRIDFFQRRKKAAAGYLPGFFPLEKEMRSRQRAGD